MDRFSKLHPTVQLLFFTESLVLIMSINSPFFSAGALICALLYSFKLKGRAAFKTFGFSAAVTAVIGVFNMLFAHYGETVLFTVKSTDFTFESLFYGINQGLIVSATLIWFDAFSRVVDSERVVYLFRFAPRTALLFSIVLGFIPRFSKKAEDIRNAKTALCGGEEKKDIKSRFKSGIDNLSALISYSLESSIITADSMQARGYNPKSAVTSRFKYTGEDVALLAISAVTFGVTLAAKIGGKILFVFEPVIINEKFSICAFICFIVLQLIPFAVDLTEDILWKKSFAKN